MLYGIYKIKQILDCSGFLFGREDLDMQTLKRVNEYDLRYDFAQMYHMLSDIQEIIDKMVNEEDENKNIDKLQEEDDELSIDDFQPIIDKLQEGEHNEL